MENQQNAYKQTTQSLFIKGLLTGMGAKLVFSIIFILFLTAVLTPFIAFGKVNDNATLIVTVMADIIAMIVFLYFYHRKNKNKIRTVGAFVGWAIFLIIYLITIAF